MHNFLKKITTRASTPSHAQRSPLLSQFLHPFTWCIIIFALITGTFLLISDAFTAWQLPHMPISAAPLLLIGSAYLIFQVLIHPKPLELFKALIVSSAFILWGIDQLLPTGWFATTLGDIVIVLYVIDLGWMMIDRLREQQSRRLPQSEKLLHDNKVSSSPLNKSIPLLLPLPPANQPDIPLHFVALSKSNSAFLKRNRLAPLSCTCASPLAPFQSATCCQAMNASSLPHSTLRYPSPARE